MQGYRGRDWETETLQRPRLGWAEVMSPERLSGLPPGWQGPGIGAIFCCFPRELNHKWAYRTSTCFHIGLWRHKRWLYLQYHHCPPHHNALRRHFFLRKEYTFVMYYSMGKSGYIQLHNKISSSKKNKCGVGIWPADRDAHTAHPVWLLTPVACSCRLLSSRLWLPAWGHYRPNELGKWMSG